MDLPYVYGFKGPEKIGDKGKYTCYHGFVIDILTNRKEFYLPCHPTIGEFEFSKEWPKCVQPKYCIGPAKNNIKGIIQPFPIRDVPILSDMRYQCNNNLRTNEATVTTRLHRCSNDNWHSGFNLNLLTSQQQYNKIYCLSE